MKASEAFQIKNAIDSGYRDRNDYPPFAIAPWDDRNRYREYIFKIIDEFVNVDET